MALMTPKCLWCCVCPDPRKPQDRDILTARRSIRLRTLAPLTLQRGFPSGIAVAQWRRLERVERASLHLDGPSLSGGFRSVIGTSSCSNGWEGVSERLHLYSDSVKLSTEGFPRTQLMVGMSHAG